MTIEEAIKEFESELKWAELNTYPYVSKQKIEADKMAIRSLEAWEKVKAEIKDIKDLYDLGKEDLSTRMFLEGIETVEQIIDKNLKEVK